MLKDSPAFSGFSVDDLEEAKRFYGELLGIEVEEMPGMGIQLKISGGHPVFVYPKDDHQAATFTVLNFPVASIDAAVADLKAKGINLETVEGISGDDGIARGKEVNRGPNIAWFKDPAGNFLSVLED